MQDIPSKKTKYGGTTRPISLFSKLSHCKISPWMNDARRALYEKIHMRDQTVNTLLPMYKIIVSQLELLHKNVLCTFQIAI